MADDEKKPKRHRKNTSKAVLVAKANPKNLLHSAFKCNNCSFIAPEPKKK